MNRFRVGVVDAVFSIMRAEGITYILLANLHDKYKLVCYSSHHIFRQYYGKELNKDVAKTGETLINLFSHGGKVEFCHKESEPAVQIASALSSSQATENASRQEKP